MQKESAEAGKGPKTEVEELIITSLRQKPFLLYLFLLGNMMSNERMKRFLSEAQLLNLTTITPDGFPHVTPVWFDFDGKAFLISTTKERKKARNLAKNNKAGFSIAPKDLPYKAVVGYGTVEMTPDPNGVLIKTLCHKYLPAAKADKYYASIMSDAGSRIIVKLTPTWVTSWEG
jgi:PPOX class probable F420-dependent enzyme